MSLTIPKSIFDAVLLHLRHAIPEEGCGLLATIDTSDGNRQVVRFYPGENIDHSPTRFTMNSVTVIEAMAEMDAMQWRLGCIVHSHPRTPPTPSATDYREAHHLDAWMLIVSYATDTPLCRLWRVDNRPGHPPFSEVAVRIAPDLQ